MTTTGKPTTTGKNYTALLQVALDRMANEGLKIAVRRVPFEDEPVLEDNYAVEESSESEREPFVDANPDKGIFDAEGREKLLAALTVQFKKSTSGTGNAKPPSLLQHKSHT